MEFISGNLEYIIMALGGLFFALKPFLVKKLPRPAMELLENALLHYMNVAENKYDSGTDKKNFVKESLINTYGNGTSKRLRKFLNSSELDKQIDTLHSKKFKGGG